MAFPSEPQAARPQERARRVLPMLVLASAFSGIGGLPLAAAAEPRTHNVILVTLDGVRTQEIFGGLDETIAEHDAQQIYSDIATMRVRFGAATPQARREALLPQFWKTLAPKGMVFGNAAHGNHLRSENRVLWSAPGYAEMLTGRPRPEIVAHRVSSEQALTPQDRRGSRLHRLHHRRSLRRRLRSRLRRAVPPPAVHRHLSGLNRGPHLGSSRARRVENARLVERQHHAIAHQETAVDDGRLDIVAACGVDEMRDRVVHRHLASA